jgi:hypothetical protein
MWIQKEKVWRKVKYMDVSVEDPSRLRSVPLSRANSPVFTISWLHCTCRLSSLTLGKRATPHENFIHQRCYVQQKRNDWLLDNAHLSTENTFLEPLSGYHLVRCYCNPSHRTVCTWRALDIRALPPFPGRWAASVVRCSSAHQVKAMTAARWRTPSFW